MKYFMVHLVVIKDSIARIPGNYDSTAELDAFMAH